MEDCVMTTWAQRIASLLPARIADPIRKARRATQLARSAEAHAARTAHWDEHRGMQGATEVEIQPGVRLLLPYDSTLGELIHAGYFEIEERHFFNAYLRPGDVFADIGANLGLYSVLGGKLVGSSGCGYAFEPFHKSHQRLQANLELNNLRNVKTHHMALSSEPGETVLHVVGDGRDAWNTLGQPPEGTVSRQEKVAVNTWDAFVTGDETAREVRLMKVDVEGWERHVFQGATQTLSRSDAPVLIVELSDAAAAQAGGTAADTAQLLADFGYSFYSYDRADRSLTPHAIRDSYDSQNLIAAKDSEAVRQRLLEATLPAWMR